MSADRPSPEAVRTPKVEGFGARAEAQLPERIDHSPLTEHVASRPHRSWTHVVLRILRDAAIAVALMATAPVIIVATRGDQIWNPMVRVERTRSQAVNPEVFRDHAVPRDPSISPLEAGAAFSRLHPVSRHKAFPDASAGSRADMTWMKAKVAPGMFPKARPVGFAAPSAAIIDAAVAGFTAAEMAYVRAMALAPAWREFDRVARAPAVDFLGARLQLPFAPTASMLEVPSPEYKITREMANAGLSRAAYHLAIGQRDSAESALRSIISFGFAMIDNATNAMDEVNGTAIVSFGASALDRFRVAVGDPRANWRAVLPPVQRLELTRDASPAAIRAWLIARAADPGTSRGNRFQALQELSYSSCTNVRELFTGPGDDVIAAFRDARTSLARFPSERAVIDLGARLPDASVIFPSGPIDYLAVSAASVAGVVLDNPRLATCSRMVSSYLYFR